MKTSLNDIRAIEKYFDGSLSHDELLKFFTKMSSDQGFRNILNLHQCALAILRMYHRKKLKIMLEKVHHKMVTNPLNVTLAKEIKNLFPQ